MLQTNAKTSYLVFVSPDNNHNKFYRMIPNVPDITRFTAEYGRVGAAGMKKVYPISSFDKIYNEKIQKGYIDQSALHQTQVMVKSAYVPTLQPSVDWLINTLLNAANKAFKTEYTISADEITDRMIDEAQAMLLKLQNCTSVSTFNTILVNMFRTIPRRMRNVSDFLAQTESDFEKIICREQELLDFTSGQIKRSARCQSVLNTRQTYLEAIGIDIHECDTTEMQEVLKHLKRDRRFDLSSFYKVYRVTNFSTEARFHDYCSKHHIDEKKETRMYYHGSNTRNWDGLLTSGPLLNPNAISCGKHFGHGIYFTHEAEKSRRYSSMCDYVRDTKCTLGFIGVYKVALGNIYHVKGYDGSCSCLTPRKMEAMHKDSLYAHNDSGRTMYDDEIVIFHEEQATIRYLIALKK